MNNYEILGLKKGASISEVKSKFRQLSKKWHPDMPGGNAAKFISIREAYEALLEGDSGEKTQQNYWESEQAFRRDQYQQQQGSARQQQWEQSRYQQRSTGEFRFEKIHKDERGYLIKFYLKNIKKITIYGKDGSIVGIYNVSNVYERSTNLVMKWEDAKKADYYFRIKLEDDFNYAEKIYTVKPPETKWEKIINKLKFWK
jgi:DnaJ-class molecular chaperone